MSQLPVRRSDDVVREAKRRKLRKGTHSCWECRRRKTRCKYESSTATVCVGCEARGTACVSQEFTGEPPPTSEGGLSQRLSRVEALLEALVEKVTPHSCTCGQTGERPLTSSASAEDELDSSSDNIHPQANDGPHAIGLFEPLPQERSAYVSDSASTAFPQPPTTSTQGGLGSVTPITPTKYGQISKALHAAFPCQQDIDTILAVGTGAYFIVKYFNGLDGPSDPPSSVAEVPPSTSHPAVLAKRLMQLTNCMQKIPPDEKELLGLVSKEPLRAQMSRFASLVSELVVSNDDLVGSVEGLEVLNLIALYHGNVGNLRKGWLAFRRANAIAQLMGVDRFPDDKPLRSVDPHSDPATRTRASSIWQRTNFSERYLSLLLGLPAASDDDSFASPEQTANDSPVARFMKLHTVITGRIIKRNLTISNANSNIIGDAAFGMTQAIDCELEFAAKSMGAAWWQPVELPPDMSTVSMRALVETHSRVMAQMNHHHLTILLHLPYTLRDPNERRWDYSKTSCQSSSRSLLHAYLVFRHLTRAASACRHIDYGALTAAMTLLLCYLDPKLRARDAATSRQRASDRELVVAVRDVMNDMAAREGDKLSRETSDIVTRLLPLMDVDRTTTAAANAHGGSLDSPVRLEIPYLGTININPVARRSPPRPIQRDASRSRSSSRITETFTGYGSGGSEGPIEPNQALHSFPALGNNNHGTSNENVYDHASSSSMTMVEQPPSSFLAALGEDPNFSFMQLEPDLAAPYRFPELAPDVDQWTFQGFDAIFFESLFS